MDPINIRSLKISNWNANSIKHKIHEYYSFMCDNFIDIACIQETMYSPSDIIPVHPEYYT